MLAFQGSRTAPVATTGAEGKECFTIVLAVRGDGEKMDPVVIFKGVQMPKNSLIEDTSLFGRLHKQLSKFQHKSCS